MKKRRTKKELRATAYHEAGHAVAHLALGRTNDKVSIIPGEGFNDQCDSAGVGGYYYVNACQRRALIRDLIIGCYAGLEAQCFVDPNPKDCHGAGDDRRAFQLSREHEVLPRRLGYIGDQYHMAFLDRLRVQARRLVRRHRDAVAALAEELLRRKEMDGAEVERLLAPMLPQVTARQDRLVEMLCDRA
jgi:ATP-dependent Zn protease